MTQRSPLSCLVVFRTDAELLSFNIHIKEQDLHTFLIRFIQHAALDKHEDLDFISFDKKANIHHGG